MAGIHLRFSLQTGPSVFMIPIERLLQECFFGPTKKIQCKAHFTLSTIVRDKDSLRILNMLHRKKISIFRSQQNDLKTTCKATN